MKKCELCNSVARMYCESDQATLCRNCDSRVHSANFLVSKHTRVLLCHYCQSLTPWTASGPKLASTLSICQSCAAGDPNPGNADEDVEEQEEEEEDDDGENQVVPLNFPSGSGTASSSSSSENSSSGGYFQGRERAKSLSNGLVSGSSRRSGMRGVGVAGRVAHGHGSGVKAGRIESQ